MSTTFGFIGTGNITSAIIPSLLASGFSKSEELYIYDIDLKKTKSLKNKYSLNIALNIKQLAQFSDVIIIAVKPFALECVLQELSIHLDNQIIISTVAGVTIEEILTSIKSPIKLARIMPNIGAIVGESMTALVSTNLYELELETVHKFLLSFGKYITLDEGLFNEFTTLCGSSPAFFADILKSFISYGVMNGMDEESVRYMVISTLQGTAKVLMSTNLSEQHLISKVATKGGTTEAGINVMRKNNLDIILRDAFKATTKKGQDLSIRSNKT